MQSRVLSVDEVRVEFLMVIPENPPAISVVASGRVVTLGWAHPDLGPWMYIVPPQDGILDLDFVALPPTVGIVIPIVCPIAVGKAFPVPTWVRGVRVHAATNCIEAMLGEGALNTMASKKDDKSPSPWPFPWWAPNPVSQ